MQFGNQEEWWMEWKDCQGKNIEQKKELIEHGANGGCDAVWFIRVNDNGKARRIGKSRKPVHLIDS